MNDCKITNVQQAKLGFVERLSLKINNQLTADLEKEKTFMCDNRC